MLVFELSLVLVEACTLLTSTRGYRGTLLIIFWTPCSIFLFAYIAGEIKCPLWYSWYESR